MECGGKKLREGKIHPAAPMLFLQLTQPVSIRQTAADYALLTVVTALPHASISTPAAPLEKVDSCAS